MSFRRKPSGSGGGAPVTAMVVGLGNPGAEYRGTRHNVGFLAVDALARRLGASIGRRDAGAQVGQAMIPGGVGEVLLVKPQTFMNLSGRAVGPLFKKHGLRPGNLWVLHDEIDITFGRLRIRQGGGAGGHNGVTSIIQVLGGEREFIRVRMGVGRPAGEETVDHVLGPFPEGERERVPALVELTVEATLAGLAEGLETAMNVYNGKFV